MQSKVMLFDEPISALDPEVIKEVLDVMVELAESGVTMVVVTHELGSAGTVADKVVFLGDSEIAEEAPTEAFFDNPRSDRSKLFMSQVPIN